MPFSGDVASVGDLVAHSLSTLSWAEGKAYAALASAGSGNETTPARFAAIVLAADAALVATHVRHLEFAALDGRA